MIDRDWLETCILAGEFLYGKFPMGILKKMYERKWGKVSRKDLEEAMEDIHAMMVFSPEEGMITPVIAKDPALVKMLEEADSDGNPYASLHLDKKELDYLALEQEKAEEYYIPTMEEITQLTEEWYIRTPQMTAMEKEMARRGVDPSFLIPLWGQVSTDKLDQMDAIRLLAQGDFSMLFDQAEGEEDASKNKLVFDSLEDINAYLAFVREYVGSINLRARKGWRPNELFKRQNPHGLTSMPTLVPGSVRAAKSMKEAEAQLKAMGATVDYSSIDSYTTVGKYGEKKIVKVGRNDPCPCGSGKKYKQCHGRGR